MENWLKTYYGAGMLITLFMGYMAGWDAGASSKSAVVEGTRQTLAMCVDATDRAISVVVATREAVHAGAEGEGLVEEVN